MDEYGFARNICLFRIWTLQADTKKSLVESAEDKLAEHVANEAQQSEF